MKVLFDADMLLYRVGYSTQDNTEEEAIVKLKEAVDWVENRINDGLEAVFDDYQTYFYLSCGREESFRAKLNPDYKAHRTQEKPMHFNQLRNYLIEQYDTTIAVEEEADDLIGIIQTADPENTIAVTVDKDILYGVVGHKFKFNTGDFLYTESKDAKIFFYYQLLVGDTADGIKGVYRVGDKKAKKILAEFDPETATDEELFYRVQSVYREWLVNEWKLSESTWTNFHEKQMNNIILLNGRMLKIRTYPDELWEIPVKLKEEHTP